jgi:hypothetical protein
VWWRVGLGRNERSGVVCRREASTVKCSYKKRTGPGINKLRWYFGIEFGIRFNTWIPGFKYYLAVLKGMLFSNTYEISRTIQQNEEGKHVHIPAQCR